MAGLAFSLFDIDRVEVLRGPQGTLFGRNATSGTAQFVSRRPTDVFEGYTDVTAGSHNLFRVEGAVSGPLWDGIDGRVAFESNHYDPLFTHFGVAGGQDSENGNDWALRGQLLFKISDKSELLLIGRVRQAGREGRRLGGPFHHQSGAGRRWLPAWQSGQRLRPGPAWSLHQRHQLHSLHRLSVLGRVLDLREFPGLRHHQEQRLHRQVHPGPGVRAPHGDRRLPETDQELRRGLRCHAADLVPILQRQQRQSRIRRSAPERRR